MAYWQFDFGFVNAWKCFFDLIENLQLVSK
jgi:hypothetical protein